MNEEELDRLEAQMRLELGDDLRGDLDKDQKTGSDSNKDEEKLSAEMQQLLDQYKHEFHSKMAAYAEQAFEEAEAERDLRPIVALEDLLQAGGDPNSRDDRRRTPLIIAAANCSERTEERALEVMRSLLERGADVDARDNWGKTALFEGGEASIQLLLSHGANPNVFDRTANTPLTEAVRRESLSDARALVAGGAKCSDCPVGHKSAMQEAIRSEKLAMVKLLIEHGANLREIDRDGRGLIYWTLAEYQWIDWPESDRLEMAKLLVESGAPCDWTDIYGWTPLHLAAINNRSEEMMRFLIANGVLLTAVDYNGDTALDEARECNCAQSVAILERLARE